MKLSKKIACYSIFVVTFPLWFPLTLLRCAWDIAKVTAEELGSVE